MKTELEIIDEVYEAEVYGAVFTYFNEMRGIEHADRSRTNAERLQSRVKSMRAIRDRAKALLKEELKS